MSPSIPPRCSGGTPPEIQRYVLRRLGADAAEDVVAETFLAAFRQRDRYDLSRTDARPWLYGIATNLVGRHRRSEIRAYRALARTGSDPVTEPFTDRVDAAVSAAGTARRGVGGTCGREILLSPRSGPGVRP